MIAKVVPLKKMPNNFFVFDYLIPKKLAKEAKVGQMVKIELRKTIVFAIIYSIEKDPNNTSKLKEILEIVNERNFLEKKDLEIYLEIAQFYKTSITKLLKMSLLPLQSNKLKKIKLKKNKITNLKKSKSEYFIYNDEIEHKNLYKNIDPKKTTLIIVPEIRLVQNISEIIPEKFKKDIVFWHSELSAKIKFENWLKIKNKEKKIIIGTRSSILLPASFFENVIIDFEQDENQKNWDSSPRFLSKDVLKIIDLSSKKNIIFASYSPSFEKYYEITKEKLKINKKLDKKKIIFDKKENKNITIYNLNEFTDIKKKNFFCPSIEKKLLERIKEKENIFIYINKKGFASFLKCKNCNFTYKCPETNTNLIYKKNENILYSPYSDYKQKFNKICPKCNSQIIEMYGFGTETIENYLKELTKNDDYKIKTIDSNQKDEIFEISEKEKSTIYIGTKKAFSVLNWKNIKTFIILDIDRELAIPEYTNIERLWHNIETINYFRKDNSELLIQSKNPEHVFFKSFGEKDRIYRTELNIRKKLFYPPYSYLIKYFQTDFDKTQLLEKINLGYKNISSILTNQKINVKLIAVFEIQTKNLGQTHCYAFALKLEKENFIKNIKFLNQYIDNNSKVDPNPITINSI